MAGGAGEGFEVCNDLVLSVLALNLGVGLGFRGGDVRIKEKRHGRAFFLQNNEKKINY